VTAPGLKDFNFTLLKSTPLTERKRLEFRAGFFNLLNHDNFGLPNLTIFNSARVCNGNDGQMTSTTVSSPFVCRTSNILWLNGGLARNGVVGSRSSLGARIRHQLPFNA